MSRVVRLAFMLGALAFVPLSGANGQAKDSGDREKGIRAENELLTMRIIPRTPQQIAAFYEARGFAREAVELLKRECFLTVGIRNLSNRVIWLQLGGWRFLTHSGELQRLDEVYWKTRWTQLNLPLANRSTFVWTVLPEVRDLQPDEPVGGNIILPKTDSEFTLEAPFVTGIDKRGEQRLVRVPNIRCANHNAQR